MTSDRPHQRAGALAVALCALALGCGSGDNLGPEADAVALRLAVQPLGSHAIGLSWKPITGATGYRIERRTDLQGNFSLLTQVARRTDSSYVDASVTPEKFYGYRIMWLNPNGNPSSPSLVVGLKTPPPPGLQVRTESSGAPAGGTFAVRVSRQGGDASSDIVTQLQPTDQRVFAPLPIGTYAVTLSNVPPNCKVNGGATVSAVVADTGQITQPTVGFIVPCTDPTRGSITVRVVTSGDGVPAGTVSYQLTVTGLPTDAGSAGPYAVTRNQVNPGVAPTTSETLFDNLRPGRYKIRLQGVPANCAVQGGGLDSLDVRALDALTKAYAVTCSRSSADVPDPSHPLVLRSAFIPTTAPTGSEITLDITLDRAARPTQLTAGGQGTLKYNAAVLQFESCTPVVNEFSVTCGTIPGVGLNWIAITTSPTGASNSVALVHATFTVIGATGVSTTATNTDFTMSDEHIQDITGLTRAAPTAFTVGTAPGGGGSGGAGGGGGGSTTGTVTGTINRAGTASPSLTGVTITVAPSGGTPVSITLGSALTFSLPNVPAGSGSVSIAGLPTGCSTPSASAYTLVAGSSASVSLTVNCTTSGGGGGGGGTSSIAWVNTFGTPGSNGLVDLTITADMTHAPSPGSLGTWSLQFLSWDPGKLRYETTTFGPNSVVSGAVSIDQGAGRVVIAGTMGAHGATDNTTGVVQIATVTFSLRPGATGTVTTQTKINQLAAPSPNLTNYSSLVQVTEGQLTLSGAGPTTGTVTGTVARTGSTATALTGATVIATPAAGSQVATPLASDLSFTLLSVPAGSGTVTVAGLPIGCNATPAFYSLVGGSTATATPVVDCSTGGGSLPRYQYYATWGTLTSSTVKLTLEVDPTTGPSPIPSTAEAANVAAFQTNSLALTGSAAGRLMLQGCSSPATGGFSVNATNTNTGGIVATKTGAGATSRVAVAVCTYAIAAGPAGRVTTVSNFDSPGLVGSAGGNQLNGLFPGTPYASVDALNRNEGTLTLP